MGGFYDADLCIQKYLHFLHPFSQTVIDGDGLQFNYGTDSFVKKKWSYHSHFTRTVQTTKMNPHITSIKHEYSRSVGLREGDYG